MSSKTGWRSTDGQRLGPLLGALCGPFTPTLHFASRHPNPVVRKALAGLIQVAGLNRGSEVTTRQVDAGGIKATLHTPTGVGPSAPPPWKYTTSGLAPARARVPSAAEPESAER